MTMFDLLTQTAKADRDLLIKNDGLGDDFSIVHHRLSGMGIGDPEALMHPPALCGNWLPGSFTLPTTPFFESFG
jgi:hypothetical protein